MRIYHAKGGNGKWNNIYSCSREAEDKNFKALFPGAGATGGGKKNQNGGVRSIRLHKRPYRKTIYANARTSYFADQEAGVKEKNGIMHTESVILRDPEGHIRGVYNGTLRLDMKRMIADIRVLKKELEATD